MSFVAQYRHGATGSSVIVEDNGRVAYGYFRAPSGDVVGDLWLYNRCPAPTEPEWSDREKAPYANPIEFAETLSPLPGSEGDLRIVWSVEQTGGLVADVYVGPKLIGRLRPGSKPGWALAAKKDGPLANKLLAY